MGSSFTVVDRGADALMRRVHANVGLRVKVGVFSNDSVKGAEGMTLTTLATIHEFGLGVPQRSFIRGWYDENQARVLKLTTRLEQRVLLGEITQHQAEQQLALVCVADIQKRIVEGIDPPNAESTVKRKGSSTPLVDTGQLKASITAEVGK